MQQRNHLCKSGNLTSGDVASDKRKRLELP